MENTLTGPVNGSDVLIALGTKAMGHCTSHTTTFNTETKERTFKPVQTAERSSALWANKTAVKKNATVKADGLRFYDETEESYAELLAALDAATPVTLKMFSRGKDDPYATGSFIITSLEETSPAGDDATYSATFESAGAVTITTANIA